jgi:hypothetical protein
MKTNIHFLSYLIQASLEWEMFQMKVVEKIKTHISCFNNIFFENCAFYEIMWKNIVQLGRPQTKIWDTHIVYWIPMATNTHSQYVILIAFPLQQ